MVITTAAKTITIRIAQVKPHLLDREGNAQTTKSRCATDYIIQYKQAANKLE